MTDKNSKESTPQIQAEMPRLLSGNQCLDFVNTVDPRYGSARREYLSGYAELVAWCRYVDLLTEDDAHQLLLAAEQRPAVARTAFHRAIAFREALYQIFLAVVNGQQTVAEDMHILNGILTEGMARATVHITEQGFAWTWDRAESALDRMLWPLARLAAELLSSQATKQLRECPGHGDCGWLFLDTSRNHRRRWCSMEGCGNRVKAYRHYTHKIAARST